MAGINFGLLGDNAFESYQKFQNADTQKQLNQQQLAQAQQATRLGAAQEAKLAADAKHQKTLAAITQIAGFNTRADALNDLESKRVSGELDEPTYTRVKSALPADDSGMPAWQINTFRSLLPAADQYAAMKDEQGQAQLDQQFGMGAPAPAPAPAQTNNLAPAQANNLVPVENVNNLGERTLPAVAVTAAREPTMPSPAQAARMSGSSHKPTAEAGQRAMAFWNAQTDLQKLQAEANRLRGMGATDNDLEMRQIQDRIKQITTHAPAASTTVITGPQEKKFEETLGAGQATGLLTSKERAEDARDMLDTVKVGRNLLKSGAITGAGANFFVSLNQGLKQAGIDLGYGDAAANSQAYVANMAQNVGKLIKQFGAGTGLSDADRDYAAKMAGGEISLDRAALEKILSIQERAAQNIIARHNKKTQGIKTNIPLTVETGETPVKALPKLGDIRDGYVYKGGDPGNQNSWEKARK
jgi:hypothetical protein